MGLLGPRTFRVAVRSTRLATLKFPVSNVHLLDVAGRVWVTRSHHQIRSQRLTMAYQACGRYAKPLRPSLPSAPDPVIPGIARVSTTRSALAFRSRSSLRCGLFVRLSAQTQRSYRSPRSPTDEVGRGSTLLCLERPHPRPFSRKREKGDPGLERVPSPACRRGLG